jgi:hypothetical protein
MSSPFLNTTGSNRLLSSDLSCSESLINALKWLNIFSGASIDLSLWIFKF